MYLVKAKVLVRAPDISGELIDWGIGQTGFVPDSELPAILSYPQTWEIISGPDAVQSLINSTTVRDSSNNVIGLRNTDGSAILFGGQKLSLQSANNLAITAEMIGTSLIYTGVDLGNWTIQNAANIGNTFSCYIENRNLRNSPLKLTPSGGTINGSASITIPFGAGLTLRCDGSSEYKASYNFGNSGRFTISKTNIPFILPPNGSIQGDGVNATLTLNSALPETYEFGCYIRLPAGAAYAGSQAGFYYSEMTDKNLAKIFNNIYVLGTLPTIPTTKSPITTVRASTNYTTSTNIDVPLNQVVIPGGLLGQNGRIESKFTALWSISARIKSISYNYSDWFFYLNTPQSGDNNRFSGFCSFGNMGTISRQSRMHIDYGSGLGTAPYGFNPTGNIDSGNDQILSFKVKLATDGGEDFVILHSLLTEVVI